MNRLRKILPRALFGVVCIATLIALFYAEERWRGDRAWARYLVESGRTEADFLEPSRAKPAIPDAENYAEAPILKRMLEEFRSGGREPDPFRPPEIKSRMPPFGSSRGTIDFQKWRAYFEEAKWIEPGEASPAQAVLWALQRYAPTLRELHEASGRPFSQFTELTDEESFSGMPYRWMVVHGSLILELKAQAECAVGQSALACADLQDGFRLYAGLRSVPGGFYGALRDFLIMQLESAVDSGLLADAWTDADLQALQRSLEAIDLLSDARFTIDTARVRLSQVMDRFEQDRFLERLITVGSRSPIMSPENWCRERTFPAGWMVLNKVKLNQMVDQELAGLDVEAGRISGRPHIHAALDELAKSWPAGLVYWPIQHLLPAEDSMYGQKLFQVTLLRETTTALALTRFRHATGQYPKQLDELIPVYLSRLPHGVVAGDPMHYLLEKGGFVLWCKALESPANEAPDAIGPYDTTWRLPMADAP